MKKLFVLSLILAIALAAGWEVLSYYESHYTGLVLYGHLKSMETRKEVTTGTNQTLGTQPENDLVVLRFEDKPQAPREPDFYTAALIDDKGSVHKLKTTVWEEIDNLLIFAVPANTKIAAFQFSEQPSFPIDYFQKFAWLRFRNWIGHGALTMIALAIIFGIVKHFKAEDKKDEHVDPFDYMKAA